MYDLGSRLKSIRLKRGITQKNLAERINKSISAVSSYESNAQLPPLDVLESIALVLNVSIDYLAGIDNHCTYSVKNLSIQEAEIIDMLFQEFSSGSSSVGELSDTQIKILQKLIYVFIQKTN